MVLRNRVFSALSLRIWIGSRIQVVSASSLKRNQVLSTWRPGQRYVPFVRNVNRGLSDVREQQAARLFPAVLQIRQRL